MKRFLAGLLSLILLAGLASCGSGDAGSRTAGSSSGSSLPKRSASQDAGGSAGTHSSREEWTGLSLQDGESASVSPSRSEQADPEELPIEGEYYYDLEDVVLYLDTYGELPENYITKEEARDLGWNGGSVETVMDGAAIGGDAFGNWEGVLPEGEYTECDLNTDDRSSRGAERLVFDDEGNYYYTEDHYETFVQVWVEDGELVW